MTESRPRVARTGSRPGHAGLPRLLAGLHSSGQVLSALDHERVHGPLPALRGGELIEMVQRSGLRGRGGADFPVGRKLRTVAAMGGSSRGGVSAVVVNGSETEPASSKDRLLFTALPHLVLDGALLAAYAVGAREVIVNVNESAEGSLRVLEGAIADRGDSRVPIRVVTGPDGYVAGEESAVIHRLNGGRPLPTFVPPRPFQRGYRGRPTLINNAETLAQIALIARFGDQWFRELGTSADPGSVLVTISGAVATPGVYELEFGTPIQDLLAAAGGLTERVQALLIGGYFGTWVEYSRAAQVRLARTDLRAMGATLGSGVVIALRASACGLTESARVVRYLAGESSGQCGPCVHGLAGISALFDALAGGTASERERLTLERWIAEVRGRGACHHPDGVARFAQSALQIFEEDVQEHRLGRCMARRVGVPVGAPSGSSAS
ncbi:MAG: SLBB domain-containing protein [Solirubrobacterales bacterium]|nr:SLBB domain-containing protein [Solirubrobacterales bacterium]